MGVTQRERDVKTYSSCGGKPLHGGTIEAKGCEIYCHETFPKDCKFGDWEPWSLCDRDCGTGQQFRTREIEELPQNCGEACEGTLKQTRVCNEQKCYIANDCQYDEWEEWTKCTAPCDGGQTMRTRKVLREAISPGKACEGNLEETMACNEECCDGSVSQDCKYAEWFDWGACTVTCGGGTKRRQRIWRPRRSTPGRSATRRTWLRWSRAACSPAGTWMPSTLCGVTGVPGPSTARRVGTTARRPAGPGTTSACGPSSAKRAAAGRRLRGSSRSSRSATRRNAKSHPSTASSPSGRNGALALHLSMASGSARGRSQWRPRSVESRVRALSESPRLATSMSLNTRSPSPRCRNGLSGPRAP